MTGRLRLLVVIPSALVGGAERYAVRVACDAAPEMEVIVACRQSEPMVPLRRALRDHGIRILDLPHSERVGGCVGFLALCALLSPDVVHLTVPWPPAAGEIRTALAILGQPSVLVHALVPSAENLGVRHRWWYRWSHRRRQHWVAVSAYGRAMLADITGVPIDEIVVIRNDPPQLTRPDDASRMASRQRVRARLGLSGEARIVVSVGRLVGEKGHDVLVDATVAVRGQHPELAVLIAGVGPDREALLAQIAENGLSDVVQLIGPRSPAEIAELLNAADAFAFPSRLEGHPIALLEAIALGVPAVVGRFGGAEEVVEDGLTGRLVPVDDADALARQLLAILADPQSARRQLPAVVPSYGMLERTRALLLQVAAEA